jgi:hypothetical protein
LQLRDHQAYQRWCSYQNGQHEERGSRFRPPVFA